MILVLIITITSCLGMILATLFKPKFTIGKYNFNSYWVITLFGCTLLFIFNLIDYKEVFEVLTTNNAINPLKILILFISMTLISIFLDEIGFFKYLASLVIRKTNANQFVLFTSFYIVISILTVFTSNDIIILTFTPFICYFTKHSKINPLPYLVSKFVAANTSSMLLIIGNPTNIYLATYSGITFIDYLKAMLIPTIFALIIAYFIMLLLFRKHLKAPLNVSIEEVKIQHKPLLIFGIFILSLSTIFFAISSYLNFEMYLIAFFAATALVIFSSIFYIKIKQKPHALYSTFKRIPYELIPFVLSMFVMIIALEKYYVTTKLYDIFNNDNPIITYGSISILFANIINNIPMSVLFTSIIQDPQSISGIKAIYAVIIGSNIGAYLTPIGALAGIMWLQILKNNNINFSYFNFIKYGILISIPTLASALLGLHIYFEFFY